MLSQTAIYAVRAAAFLAAHGADGPVLAQTIAERMHVPRNFLSKILLRLVREGMVRSIRGIHGGFVLAKNPAEIRVRDVAEVFMDLSVFGKCFLAMPECQEKCRIHERWQPIHREFQKLLDETTIDQVM